MTGIRFLVQKDYCGHGFQKQESKRRLLKASISAPTYIKLLNFKYGFLGLSIGCNTELLEVT